jgi:hypothetical protein
MIPSVNDRLASVIRALTDVIMPSLPPEAGLAQEQIQLSIGHLQILQAQLDGSPAFEAEEAIDARLLARTLVAAGTGGEKTQMALAQLATALTPDDDVRAARVAIHVAIDGLVRSAAIDATPAFRAELGKLIITHQMSRTMKDRKWFEPMGFDAGI